MKACWAIESHTYRKCTLKPAEPLKATPTESVPCLTKACPEPELLSLTKAPPPPSLFYTYWKCTNPASHTMPNSSFEKLNETNYNDWRYIMAALLVEKDLWDVVEGTETQPAGSVNSKAVRAFAKKQQLTHAKIILNIDKSQLPHTCYDDLKEICVRCWKYTKWCQLPHQSCESIRTWMMFEAFRDGIENSNWEGVLKVEYSVGILFDIFIIQKPFSKSLHIF